MDESKVVALRQKDEIDDRRTDILRRGAKRLVQQAVLAEFAAFLATRAELAESPQFATYWPTSTTYRSTVKST